MSVSLSEPWDIAWPDDAESPAPEASLASDTGADGIASVLDANYPPILTRPPRFRSLAGPRPPIPLMGQRSLDKHMMADIEAWENHEKRENVETPLPSTPNGWEDASGRTIDSNGTQEIRLSASNEENLSADAGVGVSSPSPAVETSFLSLSAALRQRSREKRVVVLGVSSLVLLLSFALASITSLDIRD